MRYLTTHNTKQEIKRDLIQQRDRQKYVDLKCFTDKYYTRAHRLLTQNDSIADVFVHNTKNFQYQNGDYNVIAAGSMFTVSKFLYLL